MAQEGFSAGVDPGGLYDRSQIELLICYMLMGANGPMPRQAVLDIMFAHGMANVFETGAAIDALLSHGSLRENGDVLTLEESGLRAAKTLTTRLPYTLRHRAVKAAVQFLALQRSLRQTSVDVRELPGGGCNVTCTILEQPHPLMTLTMRVADPAQANLIRERFVHNPTILYRAMVAILTGDSHVDIEQNKIVIDI